MATNIVDGDKCFVKIACQASDQIAFNDLAWGLTTLVGTPTYEELVADRMLALLPLYQAIMPSQASFYGISIQRFDPTFTQPFQAANSTPGTATGNLEPRQACGIISKVGSVPGKPGKGRIYVPFLADSVTSADGHLGAAGFTALNALGTSLFTVQDLLFFSGNGVRIVPLIVNNPLPTSNFISSFITRSKLGTQQRRGDYGKPNGLPW